ncbi:acetoacetate decarboxylase family protein [Methanobacterium petrolearium]|uniref:acetoacetate decarboxylase family protein n=1 Tax=Methanobacterium petrolearium TaxID=710190 RepID=UPI001AEB5C67|nr:acetoacetate decarboxylase family protein [Methanobacterium petrolearium]MBP1946125.1 hypothetical protein [Methanobacterium petrolearium]BDZ70733.1 hypothetical protein GCM10025861_12500 [Methanobacterium petrolearium]
MFKLEKDFTYSMPAHFGGVKFDPDAKLTQKATTLLISYETQGKLLENYIPGVFELLAPEVHVIFSSFREINWMLGGHYNLIDVSVPVRFNGKKDQMDGKYSLVVWENNTTPILGGREQTGIPKIYADIQDLHILKPHYATTASLNGNTFLNMNFEATGELTMDEFEQVKAQSLNSDVIGWRYIPKVGAPGAELSQFILYPQGMEVKKAHVGNGRLKWTELAPMQNPSQFHIINSLATLPIKGITGAMLSEGMVNLRAFGARIIE